MPLTQEHENPAQIALRFRCEHELTVKTMQPGIGQARANVEQMRVAGNRTRFSPDTLHSELRAGARKFAVQFLPMVAACVGAGDALGTWVLARAASPPAVQAAPPQG